MFNNIIDLQPQQVWNHFYSLTQIPRPSGHEKAVVEYIRKFAERNKLEYQIDEIGNILIRKRGQSARRGAKKVILQAHVDMVPQKNNDKKHDFISDPIETIIDNDWVCANNTTLGADNGIGVAAILAVLESDEIKHGPIEAVFTISEETGMDGAFGLKPGFLQGDILLNLDSEDEGELFVGCAGGINANISWNYKVETISETKAFRIEIKGLKGGHSGIDINLGRGNANIMLVQLLLLLQQDCQLRLSSLNGGNLRNAIPREASAIVLVRTDETEKLQKVVEKYRYLTEKKYEGVESDITIAVNECESQSMVMAYEDQKRSLEVLNKCPNGVICMSPDLKEVVQTSTNLAILRINEGKCEVQCLLRSSVDNDKKELIIKMEEIFSMVEAKSLFEGDYPGWKPDPNSFILSQAIETYKNIFGLEPQVKVIHAGLECGIIGGTYPGLDMISFGPTIMHPHSPDEKVQIQSVERFWIFLKELLQII